MKPIAQLIVTAAVAAFSTSVIAAPAPATNEAPDVLVKRVSTDVIDSVKADKDIQAGNSRKIIDLVNAKILPYVDSDKMTAQAAGRFWRQATPESNHRST
jgi:phospholipid transport system substrate-binding protein